MVRGIKQSIYDYYLTAEICLSSQAQQIVKFQNRNKT